MDKELITDLMSEIESMAMMIEGEWGSCFTTVDELIKSGDMPDSYYKLKELQTPNLSRSQGG